jgi:hypothetical protein
MILPPFFLIAGAATADPGREVVPAYAWWRLGESRRLPDGRVRRDLELIPPRTGAETETVQAFLRLAPLTPPGGGKRTAEAAWRRLALSRPIRGAFPCSIEAGGFFRAEIWAKLETSAGEFWAATAFNLYGQAADPVLEGEIAGEPEGLPRLSLTSDGEDYWPQTGHNFRLVPEWPEAERPESVKVLDSEGQLLTTPVRDSDGGFGYRPPHDSALDRAGDLAWKHIVFLLERKGVPIGFTLEVHRSRHGRDNLGAGLAVMSVSLAATAFLFRRRKVRR